MFVKMEINAQVMGSNSFCLLSKIDMWPGKSTALEVSIFFSGLFFLYFFGLGNKISP